MPRPNALVDEVKDLAQSKELRAAPDRPTAQYLTVTFGSGRTGLLDTTSHRSRVWAEVLQSLRESGQPAYVEIDPKTNQVTDVLLPVRYNVGQITPAKDGLEIELFISQTRHYLRRSNLDFEQMRRTLEEARRKSSPVLVTETLDRQEILDVRPAAAQPAPAQRARRGK